MQISLPTTPFGRRPHTLAQMEAERVANDRPTGEFIDKWKIFDDICAAKATLGVSDRTLAVLKALLSFHPATALPGEGPIIVFPSNKALARRANGMAENTLRRHLGVLVKLKAILRRDSPNGKRYARKGEGGEIEAAFGFDLALMAARAAEFQQLAAEARAAERQLRALRDLISVRRRDIDKMIATGVFEGVVADWEAIRGDFRRLNAPLARNAVAQELEPLAGELGVLSRDVRNLLETHIKSNKIDGNAAQNERHIQTSNLITFDLELGPPKSQGAKTEPPAEPARAPSAEEAGVHTRTFPLGMVLDACPDIAQHAPDGVRSWRDLVAASETVRPWLGVSPSAWEDAIDVLGRNDAAAVLAAILQRSDAIANPGGYLRSLTAKARAGGFSLGPVLMALIRASLRKRAGKMRA